MDSSGRHRCKPSSIATHHPGHEIAFYAFDVLHLNRHHLRALLRHRDQWVGMRARVKMGCKGWRSHTAFAAALDSGRAAARPR